MARRDWWQGLAILLVLAPAVPAARAQTTEQYYSGTFEWSETLSARNSSSNYRLASDRAVSISMVIDDGKVTCHGGFDETRQQWSSGQLTEDSSAHGVIDGAGLISIEFGEGGLHSAGADEVELDEDQPSYNITLSCPSPQTTATGGGQTVTTPAQDARWGSSWEIQTYDWPGEFLQPALRGSATWNHPDTDEANGVSGSVTVEWDLVKETP